MDATQLISIVFLLLCLPRQDSTDWDEDKEGSYEEAFKVAIGDSTKYLTATLVTFTLLAIWYGIRRSFPPGMVYASRAIADIGLCTLVLLGGITTFTPFHADWTEAYNVAFLVGAAAADTVLATWVFINPRMLEVAEQWIKQIPLTGTSSGSGSSKSKKAKQLMYPNGFSNKVHLTGQTLTDFVDHLRQQGAVMGIKNPVMMFDQKPGQRIRVPVGWVHQVTNKAINVKVAWDYYNLNNLHKYAALQHSIISRYFKTNTAEDYMSVNMLVTGLVGAA